MSLFLLFSLLLINLANPLTLNTSFDGTDYNNGYIFSVRANNEDIRLTGLMINCVTGQQTIKLYRKVYYGEYTTYNTDINWALEAVRDISCTTNTQTDFGGINIYITSGNTQSFILFNSGNNNQILISTNVFSKTTTTDSYISIYSGVSLTGSTAFSWTAINLKNANIVVKYQKVNSYILGLIGSSPGTNDGIMFDIITNSNAIKIKSFTWVCSLSGISSIYIYRTTLFQSYSSVATIQSEWTSILTTTTVTCLSSSSYTTIGGLINAIYIPPFTTLGIYLKIGNQLQYNRNSAVDLINDDLTIPVGVSIAGTFGSQTTSRAFAGYIHYELVDCYLTQPIHGPGTFTLTGMTTEDGHSEPSPVNNIAMGNILYLCYNIVSPFICINPRISAVLTNIDYNGDAYEWFKMSVVSGVDNGVNEICTIENQVSSCLGTINCDSTTIGSGANIDQNNGNIVVFVANGNGVDASCTPPENGQSLKVDVSITCDMTPTAITQTPSKIPTKLTLTPSKIPTNNPTKYPTKIPTLIPTKIPTKQPSMIPSKIPTLFPTQIPTNTPTLYPTLFPTKYPSKIPTQIPTNNPTNITKYPTKLPSIIPTINPTKITLIPTKITEIPTILTINPTLLTYIPTILTNNPTIFQTTKNNIKMSIIPFIRKDQEIFILILMGLGLICCLCLCFIIIYFTRKTKKTEIELKEARLAAEMTQVKSQSNPDNISSNDMELTPTVINDDVNGKLITNSLTNNTQSSQKSQKYFIDGGNNGNHVEGQNITTVDYDKSEDIVTKGDTINEGPTIKRTKSNDSDDDMYINNNAQETTKGDLDDDNAV